MLSKYPDDPGVLYLEALLTTDGSAATRIYQAIVDSHPKSEWADASLYKVYQFYYSLGLYKTADLKMAQLQREYPDSKYLKNHTEIAQVSPLPAKLDTIVAAPDTTPPVQTHSTTSPKVPVVIPPPASVGTATEKPMGKFALQVGAFASQPNAERLQRTIQALGYRVDIVPRQRTDRTMYLVWIGNYASEAEARAAATELREKHALDTMLVAR